MIINVQGKQFVASYYPFFRVKKYGDFETWALRLPSGRIEDPAVIIFVNENPLESLIKYAEYLINEYILEDDEALTPRAIEFKRDLKELFYEQLD